MTQQTDSTRGGPRIGDPDELLGTDAAAELLGVPVEQVRTMAEQGMITAVEDEAGTGFRRSELLAVRQVGA